MSTGELQQRNRELTILNSIAQTLNGSLVLRDALANTLKSAAALFNLESGWVWLLHPETGASYVAAAQNLPPGLEDPDAMEGTCWCLDEFHNGNLDDETQVIRCSRLKWLHDRNNGLAYHASVPLNAHGKPLGLLNLSSEDKRNLSDTDLRLLHTIGDMVAVAVERAQLFEQQRELGTVRERNRLAREIHDTLAQSLTGIALQLESAETLLEQSGNRSAILERIINKALNLTRASLEDARRSVMDLRATPLEGKTLAKALYELAANSPRTTTEVVGGNAPLPARISIGLYRIAQEALANAQQHADASKIRVALTVDANSAELTISDNGRGFDPASPPPDRFGLVGLNERATLLGGTLHIASTPHHGTQITARIPI